MSLNPKRLGTGEQVIRHLRTHPKALISPTFWLLVVLTGSVGGFAVLPEQGRPWSAYGLAALLVLIFVALVIVPIMRWWTTTYTITTRRIITQRGILNRVGHDLPLNRINDVSYERSLLDRLLGCGSLQLTTAADDPVVLHDVPDVERVHVAVADLLFGLPHSPADRSMDRFD